MPKLNVVRVKVIEAASSAALQAAVSDFLAASGAYSAESPERQFVDVQFRVVSSTLWAALVVYTE
jgi:hypothetical protein